MEEIYPVKFHIKSIFSSKSPYKKEDGWYANIFSGEYTFGSIMCDISIVIKLIR